MTWRASCLCSAGIVGKKHVKPDSVYKFEFDASDEVYDLQQIGRNITFMKEKVQAFLSANDSRWRPQWLTDWLIDWLS